MYSECEIKQPIKTTHNDNHIQQTCMAHRTTNGYICKLKHFCKQYCRNLNPTHMLKEYMDISSLCYHLVHIKIGIILCQGTINACCEIIGMSKNVFFCPCF